MVVWGAYDAGGVSILVTGEAPGLSSSNGRVYIQVTAEKIP